MELITMRELFKNTAKYADQEIEIGGWVRNRRPSKQFGFIMLSDGTYFTPVQVVYNDSIENFQEISKINIGAALIVKGEVGKLAEVIAVRFAKKGDCCQLIFKISAQDNYFQFFSILQQSPYNINQLIHHIY